jgi:hypothetical protein
VAHASHQDKPRKSWLPKKPNDITAPMTDNDTWVECLKCHRTYKTDSIRGVLHFYVEKCNDCVAKEEHHAIQVEP